MTLEAKHCFRTKKKIFKSLFFYCFQGETTCQNCVHFLNHWSSHDVHWVLEFRFSASSLIPAFMAGLWKLARGAKGGRKGGWKEGLLLFSLMGVAPRECHSLARTSVLAKLTSCPAFNLGLFRSIFFYPDLKCGKVWREEEPILNDL